LSKEPDGRELAHLLRACRERARRRAAEQADEGAPLHSITSSARAGTVMPSAFPPEAEASVAVASGSCGA
jgi:hypothetical protein